MTRVSPALLRFVAAANAVASPMPPHHAEAIGAMSLGRDIITPQERWFLQSCLRLPSLSERQQARLWEIAGKVEGARHVGRP
jgi:hypothetical protein